MKLKMNDPSYLQLNSIDVQNVDTLGVITHNVYPNHNHKKISLTHYELKNNRKTLDFFIASVLEYVDLNLINNKKENEIDRSITRGSNNERMMINQKVEDMQSTTKFLAYLLHDVLQRGDYVT
jgi:hypothetical protein